MRNMKKIQENYIDFFRDVFTRTKQNYHLLSNLGGNFELVVRDEKFQHGIVYKKYSLLDAILNRRNNYRRSIILIGDDRGEEVFCLLRICELLLDRGIWALYIPCYDFIFAKYSLQTYFSYLFHDLDNLFFSSPLEIKQFNNLVILFDGYDEISENDRKEFSKRVYSLERNEAQLVIATRETFEFDEAASFDYVYKQEIVWGEAINSCVKNTYMESVDNKELTLLKKQIIEKKEMCDLSKELYRELVENLKKTFWKIDAEEKKGVELIEHLLGFIGIYLFDNRKNYFDFFEFRNISDKLSDWQNKKIYGIIKKTLLHFGLSFPSLDKNIIFFHQQLCSIVVINYLMKCLKKRSFDNEIISKVFSNDVIDYIARKAKESEVFEIFKVKNFNYIVSVPCFWFDVLKRKYNFKLQRFDFSNIDFSNIDFSGCRFADNQRKTRFYNCKISSTSLGNVVQNGIVNDMFKLRYNNWFVTALSDKTVRIWNNNQGCIQILDDMETIMLKLISCKNHLIGIGINHKIYVWRKKGHLFDSQYTILYNVSNILFNCNCTNAIVVQDDGKLIDYQKKYIIYSSCEKLKILAYIWNTEEEILITMIDEFLWVNLKKKEVKLIPNKYHISVYLKFSTIDEDELFLGYDFNKILILKKKVGFDFEIYNRYILNDIIVNAFYSTRINGIIVICENGKIILFDSKLNIINAFIGARKKITACDICNDDIYIATNDGLIIILYIDTDGELKKIKQYRPLYDLNISGCKFECVNFQDENTLEMIKENGGIIV